MSRITFDETWAKHLEVVYRTRDVLRRRSLVRAALAPAPGEQVLDAGCGPGFYTAELAEIVGEAGAVTALDESADMLAVAAARCDGLANVTFEQGKVTELPFADASFDAAVSVQVLEYVPDVAVALAEMRRVVRPGGRVVVWDVDWGTVSWHSDEPARMQRVLAAWDEHLAHPTLPRRLAPLLRAAGFEEVTCEGHAFTTAELTEDAYGGAVLGFIRQYVAGLDTISAGELDAWEAEQRALGERGEFYFSVVQVCFAARR